MLPNELINLLNTHQSDPSVARCLAQIRLGQVKYLDTVLPLTRVLDVYSIRAGINSDLNGGVIQGFEGLLVKLKAVGDSCSVRLHSFECSSDWFVVFTDENCVQLFGILESPKKKAAWFDPVKGY